MPLITDLPETEQATFDKLIRQKRAQHIRTPDQTVEATLEHSVSFAEAVLKKEISSTIKQFRELVWEEYLKDEVHFNILMMQELHRHLDTPKVILDHLVDQSITELPKQDLQEEVRNICGEYAGRIFPYIYRLSLSNTNSRRSRAGKTFEAIVYKIYDILGYEFDSQSKVGRKTFQALGLGKKVDSILPNISCYEKRRNKTIIGTMKTSLRERWQEVAEEIERTKIPEIHLLTADEEISKSKATEMSNHNITIVAYDWVANSDSLKEMRNIVSFEDYFFEEIPSVMSFWEEK